MTAQSIMLDIQSKTTDIVATLTNGTYGLETLKAMQVVIDAKITTIEADYAKKQDVFNASQL